MVITGATTQVGQELVQQLTQGDFKRFFKVVAAVRNNEPRDKLDKVKSFGCETFDYDASRMDQVEEFFKKHGIKALVVAGTARDDNAKEVKAWMDAGRRTTVDFVLLLSTAIAEKDHHHLATVYHGLESYLTTNARYYTILRSTLYIDVMRFYADEVRNEKVLPLPLDNVCLYVFIYCT